MTPIGNVTPDKPNRQIFEQNYEPSLWDRAPESRYDSHMVDLRMSLIRQYGSGQDVLDLCCGSGAYLLPNLHRFRSAIAVDFSAKALDLLRQKLSSEASASVRLLADDAEELSLPDASVDFVWSYAALYTIPGLERVLEEVARILRPGGHAALELGNSRSLNSLVCKVQFEDSGWARPYFRPYGELRRLVSDVGLSTIRWHSFQLLNSYGAPRRLWFLWPLLSRRWKPLLGHRVGGKIVDEWISGVWPLRHLAFRHLAVVRKA